MKSKVQALKEAYNKGMSPFLHEVEPSIVASLLKLYLRELPEPVLTAELMPRFEQASSKDYLITVYSSNMIVYIINTKIQ